jgi:hypothetical protein
MENATLVCQTENAAPTRPATATAPATPPVFLRDGLLCCLGFLLFKTDLDVA